MWSKGDRVEVHFPMTVRATKWFHDSVALERGPLVYSLKIGEDWRKLKENAKPPLQSAEWAVFPKSDWNYALSLDSANPVELAARARKLDSWSMQHEQAGPVPHRPVTSQQPEQNITLIPYGAAKLRITAFPWTRQ